MTKPSHQKDLIAVRYAGVGDDRQRKYSRLLISFCTLCIEPFVQLTTVSAKGISSRAKSTPGAHRSVIPSSAAVSTVTVGDWLRDSSPSRFSSSTFLHRSLDCWNSH